MVKKRDNGKENLELAKEHIKIANDLVYEEAKNKEKQDDESMRRTIFSLERAQSGVEELIATLCLTVSIIGLVSGFLFFSPTITGYSVASSIDNSNLILGSTLLIIGLIFGLIWTKKRKK